MIGWKASKKHSEFSKIRFLIADDSSENLRIWEIFFEKKGYHYSSANNGLQASECFVAEDYDAVLLDVEMPEMDGLEAVRFMKAVNPLIPVIAVTSLDSKNDIKNIKNAGFDAYIHKPFNMNSAFDKIQAYLPPL